MTPKSMTQETMAVKYRSTRILRRTPGETPPGKMAVRCAEPTKPLPMKDTTNVPITICAHNADCDQPLQNLSTLDYYFAGAHSLRCVYKVENNVNVLNPYQHSQARSDVHAHGIRHSKHWLPNG